MELFRAISVWAMAVALLPVCDDMIQFVFIMFDQGVEYFDSTKMWLNRDTILENNDVYYSLETIKELSPELYSIFLQPPTMFR